jgi:hypothetical protein
MEETAAAGPSVAVESAVQPALGTAAVSEADQGALPPNQWVFMLDPEWRPATEGQEPPDEVVVGGWPVDDEGYVGLYRGNPGYRPSDPDAPTDPVDAALRLVTRAEADGSQLLSALAEVVLSIAVDDEGVALVVPAPDDVPSVLVTTAPRHRANVTVPRWLDITAADLVAALPEEGVDVLLNPGATASMRVLASALRAREW